MRTGTFRGVRMAGAPAAAVWASWPVARAPGIGSTSHAATMAADAKARPARSRDGNVPCRPALKGS